MKEDNQKQKHKYIFPDILARTMAKVDQRTQYEASMMSMSLMAIGLVLTNIYIWLYSPLLAVWYKALISANSFFGLIFMWSHIVTTYQQYLTYMEAKELQEEMKGGEIKDDNKTN